VRPADEILGGEHIGLTCSRTAAADVNAGAPVAGAEHDGDATGHAVILRVPDPKTGDVGDAIAGSGAEHAAILD
jgi:hypothetical protein